MDILNLKMIRDHLGEEEEGGPEERREGGREGQETGESGGGRGEEWGVVGERREEKEEHPPRADQRYPLSY